MMIFSLALFLPTLSIMVRRLHDIGKSGWWCLIYIPTYLVLISLYTSVFLTAPFFSGNIVLLTIITTVIPVLLSYLAMAPLIYFWTRPTQLQVNTYGEPARPKVVTGVAPVAATPAAAAPVTETVTPVESTDSTSAAPTETSAAEGSGSSDRS